MSSSDELVPLSDADGLLRLCGSADERTRRQALDVLVRLPLDEAGWSLLSDLVVPRLDDAHVLDVRDVPSYARVPTAAVRERLRQRMDDSDVGHVVLAELAKAGDPLARDRALDFIATGDALPPLRQLIAEAVTSAPLDNAQLAALAGDGDSTVAFWGALGLAREGSAEALAGLLASYRSPNLADTKSRAAFVEEVAARGPFPATIVDEMAPHAESPFARALIEGMRGGEDLPARSRSMRGGRPLADLARQLGRRTRGRTVWTAAFVFELRAALDAVDSPEIDYADLLTVYEAFAHDRPLRRRVAWTAQRGGLERMLAALGGAAAGRPAAFELMREVLALPSPASRGEDAEPARRSTRGTRGFEVLYPYRGDVVAEDDRVYSRGDDERQYERARADSDRGREYLRQWYSEQAEGPGVRFEPEGAAADSAPPDEHPHQPSGETKDAAEPSDEVPRSFFALVVAPRHVVAAEEFTLTAGTTKDAPSPDAQPFVVPASTVGPYTLRLTLHALGFTIAGDANAFDLQVTAADRYPVVDIRLTPDLQADERVERTITVFYSVDGQVIGSVEHTLVVHLEADDETRDAQREVWRRIFSTPVHDVPPDLTVMVTDDGTGNLAWSYISPHPVTVPNRPLSHAVGGESRKVAELLVRQANGRDGRADLYTFLVGLGKDVTAAAHKTLWPAIAAVAQHAGTTPSLLLISNEPYIPWELATMPAPLDGGLPPFLGAQTRMGRWIIGDRLPPPRRLTARRATVVSGKYTKPGWPNLPFAQEEAGAIRDAYGAGEVDATSAKILAIFGTQPASDLLHFSMHGQWDDASVANGLITIDGSAVAPQNVAGAIDDARRHGADPGAPFVFLNACQVAEGSRLLGDYGGLAAAFVRGGATAVVAPLWSVKDVVAKQVALEFYEATLVHGDSPAEAIRRARSRFTPESQTGTFLAYQFFGHPSLTIDGTALLRKDPSDGSASK